MIFYRYVTGDGGGLRARGTMQCFNIRYRKGWDFFLQRLCFSFLTGNQSIKDRGIPSHLRCDENEGFGQQEASVCV